MKNLEHSIWFLDECKVGNYSDLDKLDDEHRYIHKLIARRQGKVFECEYKKSAARPS